MQQLQKLSYPHFGKNIYTITALNLNHPNRHKIHYVEFVLLIFWELDEQSVNRISNTVVRKTKEKYILHERRTVGVQI